METTYVPTPTPAQVVTQKTLPLHESPNIDLDAKKRTFLNSVRNAIYAHKKYPKMAKRRNIQGTVHAIFDIQSNLRLRGL